jgi:hypothetical protein
MSLNIGDLFPALVTIQSLHDNFCIMLYAWFLLRILRCSENDDHVKNNSGKFGYILNMKIEKKSFYIFGYLVELIIKI